MNFTTDLPKINPCVKYLVATGKLKSTCYRMHVVVLASKYSRKDTLAQVAEMMKDQTEERVVMCHILRLSSGNNCKSSRKSRKYLKNDFNLSDDCHIEIGQLEKQFEQRMGKAVKTVKSACKKKEEKKGEEEKECESSADVEENNEIEDADVQMSIQPVSRRTRSCRNKEKILLNVNTKEQKDEEVRMRESKKKKMVKKQTCMVERKNTTKRKPQKYEEEKKSLPKEKNQSEATLKELKPEVSNLFSCSQDKFSDVYCESQDKQMEHCNEVSEQLEKRALLKHFYKYAVSKDKVLANMIANEGIKLISQFDTYYPVCDCIYCNKLPINHFSDKEHCMKSQFQCNENCMTKNKDLGFNSEYGLDHNASPQSFLSNFHS